MIVALMPLVRDLARRYANRGEPLDDLIQVGMVGLIKAVDRYDPAFGASLATFATPTILGEIRRYFRDSVSSVHVTRSLRETHKMVRMTATDLTASLRRTPTVREISEASGIDEEDILNAMAAHTAARPLSLSQPMNAWDDEPIEIPSQDAGFERAEGKMALGSHFRELPEMQRRILIMRLQQGMTQSEIAKEFGVSQMQVSRLISRAIDELRRRVGAA